MICRSGPLNRSQKPAWLELSWRDYIGDAPALTAACDVPAAVSVDRAVGALRTLVAHHEILRTTFAIGPDGRPVQTVVSADGFDLPVEICAYDPAAGAANHAPPALVSNPENVEFPWLVRIFADGDCVHHVELTVEHLITDGVGIRNWRDQFLDLCAGKTVSAPRLQPLDRQMAEERGARAAAPAPILDRTLALAAVTTAPVADPAPGANRYLECTVLYSGLVPVLDAAATACRASRPAVLLFALSWLLAAYSGAPRIHATTQVHNRTRGDRGIDLCASSPAFLVEVPAAGTSLRAAVRSLFGSLIAVMYEDAAGGPGYADRMLAACAGRGIGRLHPFSFNFEGTPQPELASPRASAEYASARRDFRSATGWEHEVRARVHAGEGGYFADPDPRPTGRDDVLVTVQADTSVLPGAAAGTISELLPRLISLIAAEPDADAGAAAALLPPDYRCVTGQQLVAGSWLDVDALQSCLRRHPAVQEARVVLDDAPDGTVVVAHIAAAGPLDAFDVHEHVLEALAGDLRICAPHRYCISGDRGIVKWCPVDPGSALPPATAAERALCRVLSQIYGRDFADVRQTYAQAGGELMMFPAIRQRLGREGWHGLTPLHVLSPLTLRIISRHLTQTP
ncbi:Condensation domain [Mycobacteroides abscessus subsp. abscessus]|uniref:condensation domain-containing protein n=1 Tax=Mycobacteroides abscessus TaxID=36809 RepID=UPI0002587DF2|nr:condensation domain-containing protein [Mycobacteroides abscessus]EIC67537.1 hypothetical protein OUW_07383 [Mycobacteroides abscessus M93]CPV55518.1 Condensation domain [Mycobacteroides abscessus]SHQ64557.1 Condensation domain [Mycobacteroides abscessus subsp. abscessus]SHR32887.1 Condensation domain [Mycobacteroides abscessus subsp. abscessus]SHZ30307.1 Condensation domain [Mycobacteroides abscessus subsp. abscessus]